MRIIRLAPDTPVGLRFQPTDEEIINHYLKLMMTGKLPVKDDVLAEVDFCKWDPWDLPAKSKIQSDDPMWWFLCRLEYSGNTGKRSNRRTKSGFWKITGKDRDIKDPTTKQCIGKKKILVFHVGPAPGRGTNWVMHEYHPLLKNAVPNQRPYVICRLEKKVDEKVITPGYNEGEPSASIVSDFSSTPGYNEGEPSASIISESNIENPVISGAISEVLGQVEGNPVTPTAISEVPGQAEENPGTPSAISEVPGQVEVNPVTPVAISEVPSQAEVNPVTPGAISEIPGQAEVNVEPLLQPPLSPNCYLTREDARLIFLGSGNDDRKIDSLTQECHPEQENPFSQKQSKVTCLLESKTDEKAGTSDFELGEPSGIITSNVKNQAAPTTIPEVHRNAEVDAESPFQPVLSLECYLTEEDMRSILFDDDEKIKPLSHKPETENPLSPQWPNAICNLENKTDEKAGTPSRDIGEPSRIITSDIGNQVAAPEVHGRTEGNAESSWQPLFSPDFLTEEDVASIFSTSFNCDHNKKQGLCGGDDPEVSPAEFSDWLIADPYGNYYSGETSSNLFNASIQHSSLKRPYFPNAVASSGADAVGAGGQVKRPRSLAHGDSLH